MKRVVKNTDNYKFEFIRGKAKKFTRKDNKTLSIPCTTVEVNVYDERDRIIAKYRKDWEGLVSDNYVFLFESKFLENPDFRNEFLITGFNIGESAELHNKLNIHCHYQIFCINELLKGKERERAIKALKTYGRDQVSNMNEKKLSLYVKDSEKARIKSSLSDVKEQLTAMKWVARGLKVEYSIEKVKIDRHYEEERKERQKKAMRYRSNHSHRKIS